jgi:hypothetical protein
VEVGVRKVWASRGMLTLQFVGESLFHVMLAIVIAVAFAELLLPLLVIYECRCGVGIGVIQRCLYGLC